LFQLVRCASAEQCRVWANGSTERHERTERVLRRETARGKLVSGKYGVMNVYWAPKYKTVPEGINLEHGLGTAEGLVRFRRSDMTAEIVPARYFRGMGSIPEWGLKTKDGLLLYEFCTRSNFYSRLRKKVEAYEENLLKIEARFGEASVLFVCNVNREYVEKFQPKPDWAMFTDYETFKSVPIGEQLTAPIYLWKDGGEHPLRHEPGIN
jgi:hypothetical protein